MTFSIVLLKSTRFIFCQTHGEECVGGLTTMPAPKKIPPRGGPRFLVCIVKHIKRLAFQTRAVVFTGEESVYCLTFCLSSTLRTLLPATSSFHVHRHVAIVA